jgi:hypothetical protein
MSEHRVEGACLCGEVKFHIELPTSACVHCHCSMCQRNHGAGFVTWIALPREQLTIDSGEQELVRYESSSHGSRSFCGRCGTSLLCESTERAGEVDIPLANLKGEIDRKPQLHIFFDDRANWTQVDEGLPRLGGKTGVEPTDS